MLLLFLLLLMEKEEEKGDAKNNFLNHIDTEFRAVEGKKRKFFLPLVGKVLCAVPKLLACFLPSLLSRIWMEV